MASRCLAPFPRPPRRVPRCPHDRHSAFHRRRRRPPGLPRRRRAACRSSALPGLTRSDGRFRLPDPAPAAAAPDPDGLPGPGRKRLDRSRHLHRCSKRAAMRLRLLDHLGVRKAAILGTSRGGLIGMVLGAVARDRVAGSLPQRCRPRDRPRRPDPDLRLCRSQPRRQDPSGLRRRVCRAAPALTASPMSRWLDEAQKHVDRDARGPAHPL